MRASRAYYLAAAIWVPANLACENPDTHACASALYYNSASAAAFCATYTAGSGDVPALFSSACDESKDLSAGCTCFVTGGSAVSRISRYVAIVVVPDDLQRLLPAPRLQLQRLRL